MPNAIFFYRIQRWLYLHHIPFLPKLIQLLIFLIYNTKITADSKIGKGTYFVCKGISTVLIRIVAANSFVDKSLRGGVIVAGSPAKIIGYTKDLNYNISSNQKDLDGIAPYLQPKE